MRRWCITRGRGEQGKTCRMCLEERDQPQWESPVQEGTLICLQLASSAPDGGDGSLRRMRRAEWKRPRKPEQDPQFTARSSHSDHRGGSKAHRMTVRVGGEIAWACCWSAQVGSCATGNPACRGVFPAGLVDGVDGTWEEPRGLTWGRQGELEDDVERAGLGVVQQGNPRGLGIGEIQSELFEAFVQEGVNEVSACEGGFGRRGRDDRAAGGVFPETLIVADLSEPRRPRRRCSLPSWSRPVTTPWTPWARMWVPTRWAVARDLYVARRAAMRGAATGETVEAEAENSSRSVSASRIGPSCSRTPVCRSESHARSISVASAPGGASGGRMSIRSRIQRCAGRRVDADSGDVRKRDHEGDSGAGEQEQSVQQRTTRIGIEELAGAGGGRFAPIGPVRAVGPGAIQGRVECVDRRRKASATQPSWPSALRRRNPPTSVAMHGRPRSMASTMARGVPSPREGRMRA